MGNEKRLYPFIARLLQSLKNFPNHFFLCKVPSFSQIQQYKRKIEPFKLFERKGLLF